MTSLQSQDSFRYNMCSSATTEQKTRIRIQETPPAPEMKCVFGGLIIELKRCKSSRSSYTTAVMVTRHSSSWF